jgi:hypothetical protein
LVWTTPPQSPTPPTPTHPPTPTPTSTHQCLMHNSVAHQTIEIESVLAIRLHDRLHVRKISGENH